MSNYKNKPVVSSLTRFTAAPMADPEYSRMTADPVHLTTFNAGDIVPIYCAEVLPHDTFNIGLDFVIRQNTLLNPTMGNMDVDFYAFFVPNRVVNKSWINVMGENTSGQWTAPEVQLAPLCGVRDEDILVPVGSVADYYGFPTQRKIPVEVLRQMNDLKFRGYLEIYNQYFRDQNYQPPIAYSKLNVYEGFFRQNTDALSGLVSFDPQLTDGTVKDIGVPVGLPDGSVPNGAIIQAIYGDGGIPQGVMTSTIANRMPTTIWRALTPPLKANKHHDYFTSVLPSPQKGLDVTFSFSDEVLNAPVVGIGTSMHDIGTGYMLGPDGSGAGLVGGVYSSMGGLRVNTSQSVTGYSLVGGSNWYAQTDLSQVSGISLTELRTGAAVQQVYEVMARGGSRYREFINSFFGLEVDNPFNDIPTYLGHFRRNLDLYQTAQTSASAEGSTPQGNLAAFGYTANSGNLVNGFTAVEHGYIHIFAVVRHRNIYSSMLSRDNFRLGKLDFYLPQLANLSEQPVYTREINPFASSPDGVFGYNEAWSEYRYEPDRVSGYMRPGIVKSLSVWNYADDFNSSLTFANGDFMKSNSQEVLDRTLAVTSSVAPQLKAQFVFHVTKQRPMPTYSVPGLDIV